MTELDRPIIIIGAGRSGTSLLNRILNAHPQIRMHGEFNGLVSAIWDKIWDCEAVAERYKSRLSASIAQDEVDASERKASAMLETLAAQEQARVGRTIAVLINSLLEVDQQADVFWGFQEIWASGAQSEKWVSLDASFPDAIYLHVVRHPLDFARSIADWHRQDLNSEELHGNLTAWVDYRSANAKRSITGRYVRIRYEDVLEDAERTLAPLFDRIGVPWHENCLEPLNIKTKAAGLRSPLPPGAESLMATIPGLVEALDEDGYPASRPDLLQGTAGRPAAVTISERTWLLNAPFLFDGGNAWVSKLYSMPEFLNCGFKADRAGAPSSSRLLLLEDDKALGPAHTLHHVIRAQGCGSYSHWGEEPVLFFSTSDNSDPNSNGRRYTVLLR